MEVEVELWSGRSSSSGSRSRIARRNSRSRTARQSDRRSSWGRKGRNSRNESGSFAGGDESSLHVIASGVGCVLDDGRLKSLSI